MFIVEIKKNLAYKINSNTKYKTIFKTSQFTTKIKFDNFFTNLNFNKNSSF